MEIKYSGKELKQMISESIPGYKPVIGVGITSDNKKNNSDSNKASVKKVTDSTKSSSKDETKPVKFNVDNTDLGNNKNMLDLEFAHDPGKKWKDNVKKQVTGKDSEFGNKPDEGSDEGSNEEFYKNSKIASKDFVDKEHKLKTTGLVSKFIDLPKKPTAFESIDQKKIKRLNFKNTQFLGEHHMFTLIPEDYKKDGNLFIMKDKLHDEYLVEWTKSDELSEGTIKGHENKIKLVEEFARIKDLYSYKSKDGLSNSIKNQEESIVRENVEKVRGLVNN